MADGPAQADLADEPEACLDSVFPAADGYSLPPDSDVQAGSSVPPDSVFQAVGDYFHHLDSDVPVVSAVLQDWGDYLLLLLRD
jgi:hypothetical protein